MRYFFFLIFLSFLQISCTSSKSLKVATSANMQFAMDEIVAEFEQKYDIEVDLIVSSSGKLTSQIEQGAPFDVFVAANMKYPMELFNKGYTVNEPKVYAEGKLVLWTMGDYEPFLEMLADESITKIAIANPEIAPYGSAAVDLLKKHKLYDVVEHKLVFGESVSQTNQFITTRNADIGFTAKSAVLSPKMKGKGNWIDLNEEDYSPILQGVVIPKNAPNMDDAVRFHDFLFSDASKEILVKFGYSIHE